LRGLQRVRFDLMATGDFNDRGPTKLAGLVLLLVIAAVVSLSYLQFRGRFAATTHLTVMSGRSGLVLDPGAKATYNGVAIGRVIDIDAVERDGESAARLAVEIGSRYLPVIPANVVVDVVASTIFGNKYLAFSPPQTPSAARISGGDVLNAATVTTEFQTLFETVNGISEKLDVVNLNLTLSAAAETLTGLGTRFGHSLTEANAVLNEVNPRLPKLRTGLTRLAEWADIYTAAGPDLLSALDNAVTTAGTLNSQQGDLDAVLLASIGFAGTAADSVQRGAPYLIRAAADLIPTSTLLNTYSPEFYCGIRNVAELLPAANASFGGNGYSLATNTLILGAPNPYIYPENLPRLNARGGPGGAPGCWQKITRDFWPAPYLVADTGASIAPYNHFELGQPLLTEHVWGRAVGENTINP
jgi:phospholipid/cholesterol/gamma-HCH transport system substrate-binding protein